MCQCDQCVQKIGDTDKGKVARNGQNAKKRAQPDLKRQINLINIFGEDPLFSGIPGGIDSGKLGLTCFIKTDLLY